VGHARISFAGEGSRVTPHGHDSGGVDLRPAGNPIWGAKDLLWDGDVNPEGAAIKFSYKPISSTEFFFTPAFFILEEFGGDTSDPRMWAFQGGVNWKIQDGWYLKFAPSYYAPDSIKGNDFTAGGAWGAGTNSQAATGAYQFDYRAFAGDIEIGYTKFLDFMPFIAVFGQYVQSDADALLNNNGVDDDTGYLYGIKFGHKKVNKFGLWQAKFNYRRLERDAWPDFLPDSDFYGGNTNAKGWEFEFAFGLHKNVTLGLDYYNTELIQFPIGTTDREQDILQLDLVVKW